MSDWRRSTTGCGPGCFLGCRLRRSRSLPDAAPDPVWRADPAWGELLRVVSLRNLTPAESVEFLRRSGVDESVHGRILQVTHGHPLGLALLADVASRGGEIAIDPLTPDLVAALLRRFVDSCPAICTDEHSRCAHSPGRRRRRCCGTPSRSMTRMTCSPGCAVCRSSYPGSDGLYPHDLARDVLDADLRWRDPDAYKRVFHRVWAHVHRHLTSAPGANSSRRSST